MNHEIKFTLKPWMLIGTLSCAFFLMSYLMAATMPLDIINPVSRRVDGPTAMQAFHVMFMVVFAIGSVISAIVAIVSYK